MCLEDAWLVGWASNWIGVDLEGVCCLEHGMDVQMEDALATSTEDGVQGDLAV